MEKTELPLSKKSREKPKQSSFDPVLVAKVLGIYLLCFVLAGVGLSIVLIILALIRN
ncbi:MAG: hypothetical protein QF738_11835 [Rhodospirillales bacterium]|jgi:hypothetical protein|nr:hypothetical protein [Rhodospirillales bacterium]